MRRNFLEPVDPGNRKHAGFLVNFEFIAVGSLNFFTVRKPDYEHDVPLESLGSLRASELLAERCTPAALKLCYAYLSGARHAPPLHIRGPSGAKNP